MSEITVVCTMSQVVCTHDQAIRQMSRFMHYEDTDTHTFPLMYRKSLLVPI